MTHDTQSPHGSYATQHTQGSHTPPRHARLSRRRVKGARRAKGDLVAQEPLDKGERQHGEVEREAERRGREDLHVDADGGDRIPATTERGTGACE